MEGARIPVNVLNENLRRLGRSLDQAIDTEQRWQGEEYGLHCTWPDGFSAFVGFGAEASALFEAWGNTKH